MDSKASIGSGVFDLNFEKDSSSLANAKHRMIMAARTQKDRVKGTVSLPQLPAPAGRVEPPNTLNVLGMVGDKKQRLRNIVNELGEPALSI